MQKYSKEKRRMIGRDLRVIGRGRERERGEAEGVEVRRNYISLLIKQT